MIFSLTIRDRETIILDRNKDVKSYCGYEIRRKRSCHTANKKTFSH